MFNQRLTAGGRDVDFVRGARMTPFTNPLKIETSWPRGRMLQQRHGREEILREHPLGGPSAALRIANQTSQRIVGTLTSRPQL
jgi:hypothetical protein